MREGIKSIPITANGSFPVNKARRKGTIFTCEVI